MGLHYNLDILVSKGLLQPTLQPKLQFLAYSALSWTRIQTIDSAKWKWFIFQDTTNSANKKDKLQWWDNVSVWIKMMMHIMAMMMLTIVLWLAQRLSTFMLTQRIFQHVDIIFNISTKEEWKKLNFSNYVRSCNELCNYFWIKEWNIIGSKTPHYNKLRALFHHVFPNYISFTTSFISASQQKLCILC